MDTVLYYCDEYLFDGLYAKLFPSYTRHVAGKLISSWPRDDVWRASLSLFLITSFFGWILYFVTATLSYYFVFDHSYKNHPKFLKNQVRMEIECATNAIPWMTLLTLPWFLGEVFGKSMLYGGMPKSLSEWAYIVISVPVFLFFTDCGIYWFHRWMHHPSVYKYLHKLHHKWIIPTPFASHAFNPFDGYIQSLPYHMYAFLIPMHKFQYLFMFCFVNFWTVMIHDGEFISHSEIINTSAHHFVHHVYFNYNYGQYFTFWDRVGGSHRQPTDEQYDKALRDDHKVMARQAHDADTIENATLSDKLKTL
ncbi:uncharacterized protein B0P05DRAFT_634647 [Gilbertella persicaria]|uniref:uncharacterized protein n=1 Tax=Gilbertella persicaria TaxID=101096 RepID=UPI00221FEA86|nr:uncharacterized protein B0P05DRAFT_634647 [Gilbertella persicaria]KAI8090952.1 hypothetical protein B0P05DRAFT_634647 [Gilbertella persicaria]